MERELHIGVSKGGPYLLTSLGEKYGMDIDRYMIGQLTKNYAVQGVVADATGRLPFSDNAFSHVDMVFPFGTLLSSLELSQKGIWDELERVLDTRGSVRIIYDVVEPVDQSFLPVFYPSLFRKTLIKQCAELRQFSVSDRLLSFDEIEQLGTWTALNFLKDMKKLANGEQLPTLKSIEVHELYALSV